jgi:hypothetical protein
MDGFRIDPPLVVKDTPKPRRLDSLAEARAFVQDAMRLGRPPPWRDIYHRLRAVRSEDQSLAVGRGAALKRDIVWNPVTKMESAMRSAALGAVLLAITATGVCAQDRRPSPQTPLPPDLMVAPIAPKIEPEPSSDSGGKPATICQELVAFVEQRSAALRSGAMAPGAQSAGPGVAQPPSGPPAIDVHQHRSGLPAPVPPGETAAKPPLVTLDQARAYASANDLRACQEAARQMRRAGVSMPDGLIALAALRPELLEERQSNR